LKIAALINDKALKSKAKSETLSRWLLNKIISTDELIAFAQTANDVQKATCIEALEYASKQDPAVANEKCLQFVTKALTEKAPRVKWESARVIGNIAHLFPTKLNKAVVNLLANSEYDGTVVRWAAAFALGEILKLNTKLNKELLPAIEAICNREQDNAIKKKYLDAMKKTKK
jgi:HEAT repeat protein